MRSPNRYPQGVDVQVPFLRCRRELCLASPPPTHFLQHSSATTPVVQDDIEPAAYIRHTLANFCGESLPHQGCARREPGRTERGEERSTTNRARAALPRGGAMHPNTSGAGRTHMGRSTRRADPPLPEWWKRHSCSIASPRRTAQKTARRLRLRKWIGPARLV